MSQTLASLIVLFLTQQTKDGLAPATLQSYKSGLNAFCLWAQAQVQRPPGLRDISPAFVGQYIQYIQTAYAPNTVANRHTSLTAFARWATTNGYFASDPMLSVERTPQPRLEATPRWLSPDQRAALEATLEQLVAEGSAPSGERRDVRNAAMVYVMLETSLRESQVVALMLEDVGPGTLRAAGQPVAMSKAASGAVQAWLHCRPQSQSPALFISQDDRLPLSERSLKRNVVALVGRQAGLEMPLTPGILRQTFAKRQADAGVAPRALADLLGLVEEERVLIYYNTQPDTTTPSLDWKAARRDAGAQDVLALYQSLRPAGRRALHRRLGAIRETLD